MDISSFREFRDRQSWIFAKTYVNRAPHEYIVRGRINGTDEEFMETAHFILDNGITMYFWNHPNRYIFLDGHQYWVMWDGVDDSTAIINRCNIEEYRYTVAWKGKQNAEQ